MRTPQISFCFDVISPYAWIASKRIRAFAARHGAALHAQPVLLGAILAHHGSLGPAELPAKRAYTWRDAHRCAAEQGLDLEGPARHPFNPLLALRACTPAASGDAQWKVIDALFDAGWARGADLSQPEHLAQALDAADLDAATILALAESPQAKQALQDNTTLAIVSGVFGVPSFLVNGELFWGNDRFEHMAAFLAGKDPIDGERIAAQLERPSDHRQR
ncbi:MAG: 2-hydroxychromene-2-carboxylate isomerase [Cognaticolwellia sp.]|jgi:2-hydroxychromene-2-carboxylate isomerase